MTLIFSDIFVSLTERIERARFSINLFYRKIEIIDRFSLFYLNIRILFLLTDAFTFCLRTMQMNRIQRIVCRSS